MLNGLMQQRTIGKSFIVYIYAGVDEHLQKISPIPCNRHSHRIPVTLTIRAEIICLVCRYQCLYRSRITPPHSIMQRSCTIITRMIRICFGCQQSFNYRSTCRGCRQMQYALLSSINIICICPGLQQCSHSLCIICQNGNT